MKIALVDKDSEHYVKLQDFIEKHQLFFHAKAWLNNYPPEQIRQCAVMNNNKDVIGCFFYFVFKKSWATMRLLD